jgi:iron(III) transport system substrate-binding protein
MMRSIVAWSLAILLIACSDDSQRVEPPLVVYASEDDPVNLLPLFAEFTSDTGIPIEPVWGESSANTDALVAKQGKPADLLITANVADIVRAADEGALRPISSGSLATVRTEFKDPDKLWVALQARVATVVVSPGSVAPADDDYEALAQDAYRGKLCLSSSANSLNQSLIAWLIEDLERKPAERVVRGWVQNLAAPPYASETDLVGALESGACKFGIVSSSANTRGMTTIALSPSYFDVSAVGVGRHAQNPELAQRLVDWLIVNHPVPDSAEGNGKSVAIAGWRNKDAQLLAERAGYN